MREIKLAILDLYDNTPNQGMRCIHEIIDGFKEITHKEVYDIRGKAVVPDLSYDIYICTGGPGSPLDGDGHWEVQYFDWMQQVWDWNENNANKKYVFFICHSFQMACHYYKVGKISKRLSPSFGIYPVVMTDLGISDPLFKGLNNPFWAADFRAYQVIEPNYEYMEETGMEILALEKVRPHVPLERALMAVRFSEEIVGVQFHPEADPEGMLQHFMDPERRKKILEEHSERKYLNMMKHLYDSDRLKLTHEIVLPLFLFRTINKLIEVDSSVIPIN
ncbi:MAG: GMP synthase [Bacteroidota bacterium]